MSKKSIYPGDCVYTPEILAGLEVVCLRTDWSLFQSDDPVCMVDDPNWILEIRNIPLFRLGTFSPWTQRFYADTELSRSALQEFAEKVMPAGEFRNPSTKKLSSSEALHRVRNIALDRLAVCYRDLRVEVIEGNAHLIGTLYTASTFFGRLVRNHIAEGGKFRIALRSLTFEHSTRAFNTAILKEITDVLALDINIDDHNTDIVEMFKTHSRDLHVASRSDVIASYLHGVNPKAVEQVSKEPVALPVDGSGALNEDVSVERKQEAVHDCPTSPAD